MPDVRSLFACLVIVALGAGCGDEVSFALGRELTTCDGNVPTACTLSAGCVLDQDHYLSGHFPGARRFIARAAGGETLRIGLLLTDQRSPGSELIVTVHEPNCSDRHTWDSGGRDIFRVADSTGVLVVPVQVRQPGDHMVEFVSDAYCDYALVLDP